MGIFKFLNIKPNSDLLIIESIHNYYDHTDNIVRKGAIKSSINKMLLIPINMAKGIAIFSGIEDKAKNYSSPHGMGRKLKRKDRHTITMDDF